MKTTKISSKIRTKLFLLFLVSFSNLFSMELNHSVASNEHSFDQKLNYEINFIDLSPSSNNSLTPNDHNFEKIIIKSQNNPCDLIITGNDLDLLVHLSKQAFPELITEQAVIAYTKQIIINKESLNLPDNIPATLGQEPKNLLGPPIQLSIDNKKAFDIAKKKLKESLELVHLNESRNFRFNQTQALNAIRSNPVTQARLETAMERFVNALEHHLTCRTISSLLDFINTQFYTDEPANEYESLVLQKFNDIKLAFVNEQLFINSSGQIEFSQITWSNKREILAYFTSKDIQTYAPGIYQQFYEKCSSWLQNAKLGFFNSIIKFFLGFSSEILKTNQFERLYTLNELCKIDIEQARAYCDKSIPVEKSLLEEYELKYNAAQGAIQQAAYNAHKKQVRNFIKLKDEITSTINPNTQPLQLNPIQLLINEYQDLNTLYLENNLTNPERFTKRIEALSELQNDNAQEIKQTYTLSDKVRSMLEELCYDSTKYLECTGNQLQQVIHQECITLLERVATISDDSILASYKQPLVSFISAACDFSKQGYYEQAMQVADLAWTILDYGSAVLEGVGQGALRAVKDVITHPLETATIVVAGDLLLPVYGCVLAYHLSKVTYQLGKIGYTYLQDPKEGSNQWNEYIKPLEGMTLRDAVKGTAEFASHTATHAVLISGIQGLFKNAANRTAHAIKNKLTPEQYMTTPDGQLVKVFRDSVTHNPKDQKLSNVLKHETDKLINGAKNATLHYPKFSNNQIQSGVQWIISRSDKIKHIFKNPSHDHKLESLLAKLGNEENVIREVLKAANGKLPDNCLFKDVPISVSGYTVYVRGIIDNGIPKLGTFYIK